MTPNKGHLPLLAPFPARAVKLSTPLGVWREWIGAWKDALRTLLASPSQIFEEALQTDSTIANFLLSFVAQVSPTAEDERDLCALEALGDSVLLLVHRALLSTSHPSSGLLQWRFLADVCSVFRGRILASEIVAESWSSQGDALDQSLAKSKAMLVRCFQNNLQHHASWYDLRRFAHLLHALPRLGEAFLSGSDLIDTLASSYLSLATDMQRTLLVVTFLSISGLLTGSKSGIRSTSDVLFGFSDLAERSEGQELRLFLQDLTSATPLLHDLDLACDSSQDARLGDLRQRLEKYVVESKHARQRPVFRGNRVIRGQISRSGASNANIGIQVVRQIRELFPHLEDMTISKLLEQHGNDAQTVITILLESSDAQRSEATDLGKAISAPPASLDPQTRHNTRSALHRHNVFDDDELDPLVAADASRLYMGRKNPEKTADDLLAGWGRPSSNKDAILSALAAFDADDDERDDTYDIADVGGTVDSKAADGLDDIRTSAAASSQDSSERVLFQHWRASPQLFERGAGIRRSPARDALRSQTAMTDEAIEGWAIMLQRDPRRLRALEAKHGAFDGRQRVLPNTSWQSKDATGPGHENSDSDLADDKAVASPSGKPSTSKHGGQESSQPTGIARERKEVNKASRGNHNRRKQRARKLARAEFQ